MGQEIQDQVFAIVKRVLRVDDVPPNVDFFDLGAGSLPIIQIVDLVRKECDSDVWITDAFDAPDVASFAALAATRVRTSANGT